MKSVYLGIDIGGMSIKAGVVDKDGYLLMKDSVKTRALEGGAPVFIEDVKNLITKMFERAEEQDLKIISIGFGVPGLVNPVEGRIDYMANLKLENINLRKELRMFNVPIYISNDANVACLGEAKFGAARGFGNVILLTLGTGVGGGVLIDGKLFEGVEGKGAELGHMTLIVSGEQCGCGRKGCFEAYASASALLRLTRNEMLSNTSSLMWEYCHGNIDEVNGLTSFECAKKGDESANRVVDLYVKYLSEGILSYCNIFRPNLILLGGGVSNQGDYLINKIKEYCEKFNYGYKRAPIVEIKVAALKNDAGIIGAAALGM